MTGKLLALKAWRSDTFPHVMEQIQNGWDFRGFPLNNGTRRHWRRLQVRRVSFLALIHKLKGLCKVLMRRSASKLIAMCLWCRRIRWRVRMSFSGKALHMRIYRKYVLIVKELSIWRTVAMWGRQRSGIDAIVDVSVNNDGDGESDTRIPSHPFGPWLLVEETTMTGRMRKQRLFRHQRRRHIM